jgi:hypothetical protein
LTSTEMSPSADITLGMTFITPDTQGRDLMTHPVVGPALHKLIEERGGIKGRVDDLLSDPVSQDSALIFPLISVTSFLVSRSLRRRLRSSLVGRKGDVTVLIDPTSAPVIAGYMGGESPHGSEIRSSATGYRVGTRHWSEI